MAACGGPASGPMPPGWGNRGGGGGFQDAAAGQNVASTGWGGQGAGNGGGGWNPPAPGVGWGSPPSSSAGVGWGNAPGCAAPGTTTGPGWGNAMPGSSCGGGGWGGPGGCCSGGSHQGGSQGHQSKGLPPPAWGSPTSAPAWGGNSSGQAAGHVNSGSCGSVNSNGVTPLPIQLSSGWSDQADPRIAELEAQVKMLKQRQEDSQRKEQPDDPEAARRIKELEAQVAALISLLPSRPTYSASAWGAQQPILPSQGIAVVETQVLLLLQQQQELLRRPPLNDDARQLAEDEAARKIAALEEKVAALLQQQQRQPADADAARRIKELEEKLAAAQSQQPARFRSGAGRGPRRLQPPDGDCAKHTPDPSKMGPGEMADWAQQLKLQKMQADKEAKYDPRPSTMSYFERPTGQVSHNLLDLRDKDNRKTIEIDLSHMRSTVVSDASVYSGAMPRETVQHPAADPDLDDIETYRNRVLRS